MPLAREALEARQLEQLRRLVAVVAGGNPFYQERWKAVGVAPVVASLDDFRRRFPFTRKHELVADQAEHPPYGTDLSYPLDRYTRCHGTSGSTGNPLRWLDTPESWEWMLGNWSRVYAAAGVGRGDRVFFAFSFGPFLGFWTAFEAALKMGCLCLPGGGMTSVARLRSILDQQATVLCGTPTYALHLGKVARDEGLDLRTSHVRRILVAGEPGGSQTAMRQQIESLWPGASVSDHHGMTEVGPVSYACRVRPGILHIIEDSYLAEVVNPETGEAVEGEGLGELTLTTLGRLGSPLVRYRTGDLVRRVQGSPNQACLCGSTDLGLDGGLVGRVDDMVVVRGVNVFPSAVDAIVRSVGGVEEYRVEVRSDGGLTELALDVEVDGGISGDAKREAVRQLEGVLQTRLGLRVPVRLVEAGALPRSELKARRWIRLGAGGSIAG